MLLIAASQGGASISLIEGCLTTIAVAVAFAWPRLGANWFSRFEQAFDLLARNQCLAVVTVGITTLVLRLAILPFILIPLPFLPDDFSFLLAADTFAHGRLTNPTPAMWTHFESFHISMQPTYQSMYFPGQALLLAVGKLLFGNPWFGVLICSALMCAAICWMLQAWLPSGWALLGGFLAMLRLGLFSYWVNTYTGGALITALGGALVLGALPRLKWTARFRYGLLMAVGIALLGLTRPYEGLLLCLPVAVALLHWILFGKNRPNPAILLRRAALPLVLIVVAGAWLGFYDYRAFGSPKILPYSVNRAEYAVAPYFVWQSRHPEPVYRHELMRNFYTEFEIQQYAKIHSVSGFFTQTLLKVVEVLSFFAAFALLPPLIMMRRALFDRRIRFLVLCLLVVMVGMGIEIYFIPHYVATFTVLFYAVGLQAMRHLRMMGTVERPAGTAIVRLTVVVCVLMAGVRLFDVPLKIAPEEWPVSHWVWQWYGPDHFGTERARIQAELEQLPGNQMVIVRYAPTHYILDEWVYNRADIDHSKVVWAREMDATNNEKLINYYRDRKVWLVEPDTSPARVSPYPSSVQPHTGQP
ncbi:MAG: hypothetical protein ABSD67_13250 [Terracidiphilus sp.]|jgi:hypothetical protein